MLNESLSFDVNKLIHLLENGEERLIDRLYHYATELNFVKYTSTLKEAWRISIEGLTKPLINALKTSPSIPDFGPDEDYEKDPIASFGILEAKRHRNRGITLGMFLALMKYYRQSYIDLLKDKNFKKDYENYGELYINRFFDRVELGFCTEWISNPQEKLIEDLQNSNRLMTNEKNKYLTFFESLPNPAFFINLENKVENFNNSAAELLGQSIIPGATYYSEIEYEEIPSWIKRELNDFVSKNDNEFNIEKSIETRKGRRYFNIKMKKMLDISTKFSGTIVILENLTDRISAESKLLESEKRYKNAYDRANFYQDIFAHDINNVLNNVNFSAVLLSSEYQNNRNNVKIEETLERINNQVKRGAYLVSTVLKLSKIENKNISLERTDVCNILNKAIEFLRKSYGDKIINVDIKKPKDEFWVMANELLLDLFENILINAVKHNNNNVIQISVKLSNFVKNDVAHLKIEIRDNGVGIPDKDKKSIFQRVYGKKRTLEGLGLGLSLVKKIIDSYDGQIWVENNVKGNYKKGSNFVVLLPTC